MALEVGVNSYISVDDADGYFEDALHAGSWSEATSGVRAQSLVTATRMLDRQKWRGSKTTSDQDLAWPRSGLSDVEGLPIDPDEVPDFMLDATCELALALIEDADIQNQADTGSNISRLKAGPAEIQYFASGTSGPRFPIIIHELIGSYLAGSTLPLPFASGTDVQSGLGDFGLSGAYDA
jgi:hypothetical protein